MKRNLWKWVSLVLAIALLCLFSLRIIDDKEYNEQKLEQLDGIYDAIEELIPFTRLITSYQLQLEEEEEDLILTQLKLAYMNHFQQVADTFNGTILEDDMDGFLADFDEVMTTYINMKSKEEAAMANTNLRDLKVKIMSIYLDYDIEIN